MSSGKKVRALAVRHHRTRWCEGAQPEHPQELEMGGDYGRAHPDDRRNAGSSNEAIDMLLGQASCTAPATRTVDRSVIDVDEQIPGTIDVPVRHPFCRPGVKRWHGWKPLI